MQKLTYVKEKELLVLAIKTVGLSPEKKDAIRKDLTDKTGIEKVIIVEGEFEYIGEENKSEKTTFYGEGEVEYAFKNN